MRIVAGEVGLDQLIGHELRFPVVTSERRAGANDEGVQGVGGEGVGHSDAKVVV